MKKQTENEVVTTVKVTGVYLTNKPISSFPSQTSITIGGEDKSAARDEFMKDLKKVSRKTSAPVLEMK